MLQARRGETLAPHRQFLIQHIRGNLHSSFCGLEKKKASNVSFTLKTLARFFWLCCQATVVHCNSILQWAHVWNELLETYCFQHVTKAAVVRHLWDLHTQWAKQQQVTWFNLEALPSGQASFYGLASRCDEIHKPGCHAQTMLTSRHHFFRLVFQQWLCQGAAQILVDEVPMCADMVQDLFSWRLP